MPSPHQAGTWQKSIKPYPGIEARIGHNPARFLDLQDTDFALARIRGIDKIGVANAYLKVERDLPGHRPDVEDAISERRDHLIEHGEREDPTPEELAALREVIVHPEDYQESPDPVWQHEGCNGTDVDQESSTTWYCRECEQRTNRVTLVNEDEVDVDGTTAILEGSA